MEHELKTWPTFYQDVLDGRKPFEIRKNDRHFEVGDDLCLMEFDPASSEYTGRRMRRTIIYKLAGFPGIEKGYCVLGIGPVVYVTTSIPGQRKEKQGWRNMAHTEFCDGPALDAIPED